MAPYFWPFIFLLIALGLMVLELFIPSAGLLGIVAGLCLLSGIIAAYVNVGFEGGSMFLFGCSVFVPLAIVLLIRIWPNTPLGKRILVQPPADDELLPSRLRELESMVGKTGITISSMLPSGALRIDGKLVDAVSDGLTIEKGAHVKVVSVRGNYLVVRPARPPADVNLESPTSDLSKENVIPDPFDDGPLT